MRGSGRRSCAAVSLRTCSKAGTVPTCLRVMLCFYASLLTDVFRRTGGRPSPMYIDVQGCEEEDDFARKTDCEEQDENEIAH